MLNKIAILWPFAIVFFISSADVAAQKRSSDAVPMPALLKIVKAEDERRYDGDVESLLKDSSAAVRRRATLAAGRIGDVKSVPALANLLSSDTDASVRAMAAFALGEIESPAGAEAIWAVLVNAPSGRARAIEAAGKIAAANVGDPKTPVLGKAIVTALEFEARRRSRPDTDTILLGLTAVLRAKPEGGEDVVAEFLGYADARIRADALNTLARLRAKNANESARELLAKDLDAVVRANAARLLGAAEDASAKNLLLTAAVSDKDSRVRVSAIRAVAGLKDATAAEPLLNRAEKFLAEAKRSKTRIPAEKSELLELAAALGRLLFNSNHKRAVDFLRAFAAADKFRSPEINIAFARLAPLEFSDYLKYRSGKDKNTWQAAAAAAQGLAELAKLDDAENNKTLKATITNELNAHLKTFFGGDTKSAALSALAVPDVLTAYAAFKPADLGAMLRSALADDDLYIRAAAAGLIADQPAGKENADALRAAFDTAFLRDKDSNDAQLAILDALNKIDHDNSFPTFFIALNSNDYLARKKAFEILRGSKRDGKFFQEVVDRAVSQRKDRVLPYAGGSKLGQLTNTDADYRRALSRKNGQTKAVLMTEKGSFIVDLLPEDAPLTVDNFIKLARSGYFNGVSFHRVVPNFVAQGGDPRGDGNGGPGWQIRCEVNMAAYTRGAVGMALSGKDTGGSQWFITHSPQPHLDGGYTVFGRVSEADMPVVDALSRDDKIISVKILETASKQPGSEKRKR
jgi:cyclophilin family peptidyl-prolyl cis-trans isomerase/HEAT repeat protein